MARHALSLSLTMNPRARSSCLALVSTASRRALHSTPRQANRFERSDFSGQGFVGEYEPGQPTGGPLGEASIAGVPRVTPKRLKDHLDQFVVGQERAKKVLSVAVYNHYQRVQEVQRREEEQARLEAAAARRNRHPVEDEYPGQQQVAPLKPLFASHPDPPKPEPFEPPPPPKEESVAEPPILDTSPLTIEKSNVLLLGPSGVGKTLMIKTLARVLDVPISISDCTPFTSAGYIGEDVEVCVQRLISAANFDIAAAERGIIVLDEIDKIAAARVNHGKDVGGEGVQQALLKIIEGTTLQIQVKQERSASSSGRAGQNSGSTTPPAAKGEILNIKTDNILFICAGAFVGLHKMVLDRVSKGGLGFGAQVRATPSKSDAHDTMLAGEDAMFKKHLPFFVPKTETPQDSGQSDSSKRIYNTLDLVGPGDLQKFGMIPELIGRIPISCALSSLDEEALVRVLTEPRNSLLGQYEQLFKLSGIELGFTSGALREVAKAATGMGTGARGLRTVLERLLSECMYEAPGSPTKYVLITQSVAQLKQAPMFFRREERRQYDRLFEEEEQAWQDEQDRKNGVATSQFPSFEEYRTKSRAVGIS